MTDDFDTVLNRCLADVAAGRSIGDSLRGYPQFAPQLEPLLRMAGRLRALPAPADLPVARAQAIEARLLKQATEMRRAHSAQPTRPRWPVFRLVPVAAALVFMCSVVGFGVSSASATSLPGDILYPAKRLLETTTVMLTPATGQVDLHLSLAQRRLDEFSALADRNEIHPELLAEVSTETDAALSAAETVPEAERQTALEQVVAVTDRQTQQLSAMMASAPDTSASGLETMLAAIAVKRGRAVELLATKTPFGTPPGQSKDTSTPVRAATGTSTPTPVLPSPTGTRPGQVTSEPKATSPGQGTPKPKITAPGQETPKPKVTPPGQGTPKPKVIPPGQQSTPKPKVTPPGQGGSGSDADPPDQDNENKGGKKK